MSGAERPGQGPGAGGDTGPAPDPAAETTLLLAAFRDAANAWTERIRVSTADPAHATTCGVCPLCLTIAHVGHGHPDLMRHVAEVVSAVSTAAAAATQYYQAAHPPPAGPGRPDPGPEPPEGRGPAEPPPRNRPKVQRIALD